MPRLSLPSFALALVTGVAVADDCDSLLQPESTLHAARCAMRDAREYLRCVASQMSNQVAARTSAGIPAGVIHAWDPLVRDENGKPTGGYRAVPLAGVSATARTEHRT